MNNDGHEYTQGCFGYEIPASAKTLCSKWRSPLVGKARFIVHRLGWREWAGFAVLHSTRCMREDLCLWEKTPDCRLGGQWYRRRLADAAILGSASVLSLASMSAALYVVGSDVGACARRLAGCPSQVQERLRSRGCKIEH